MAGTEGVKEMGLELVELGATFGKTQQKGQDDQRDVGISETFWGASEGTSPAGQELCKVRVERGRPGTGSQTREAPSAG